MKTTTRETYAKRIERVLDLLAADTDHTLDIYRLAEEAYLSPYHFHRVYVAMMGETVNDTIRRKRLHQSAVWLISSNLSVAAIASRAKYASVQAFTRAFREAYGVPPAKYRLHGQLSAALRRSQSTDRTEKTMFNLNQVAVKDLPAVRVATLAHHGDYQTIGDSFGRLAAWAAGKVFLTHETPSFGIYCDDPMSKPKSELLSDACISAPDTFEGDGNVKMKQTPGGKCAVFTFTGPYAELEKPYRWLYESWLPQSGEEPRDAPPYEAYLNDARSTPPHQLLTSICIPLK
jgi:AraC family transcriptional regulator